jgi:hypothetical protein
MVARRPIIKWQIQPLLPPEICQTRSAASLPCPQGQAVEPFSPTRSE